LVGFFLGLLELIRTRQVMVEQETLFGDIWISRVAPAESTAVSA
jgi:chromatin segregation and condensation protein Rec8/ScpA/Scc1 (kleisin family)